VIISRAPLRLSLAGGGTDLPWYAAEHTSRIIATSIDKYVYIACKRRLDDRIRVAYSKDELVDDAAQLRHPLLRTALAGRHGVELHSMADVPANSGLGSSGAFMVAIVAALDALDEEHDSPWEVAARAWEAERAVDPNTGWQDHAVAAMGGTRLYSGAGDLSCGWDEDRVSVTGLDSVQLWNTGIQRKASDVLAEQAARHDVQDMNRIASWVDVLLRGAHVGAVFRGHWSTKRLAQTAEIDALGIGIEAAGCRGAKLVGAGGGGYFAVCDPSPNCAEWMRSHGMTQLPVRFGVPGVEVLRWGT
jgi:D-glycero-alpha-D-manno-heptose-7-phosphate kinase